MIVLDASALIAFLRGEPGSDMVKAAFEEGAVVGAANWSEVAQKARAKGDDWNLVRAVLEGRGVTVEPVIEGDAERAAERWTANSHLSLGDRLCLALADRLGVDVLTADSAWGDQSPIRQIR